LGKNHKKPKTKRRIDGNNHHTYHRGKADKGVFGNCDRRSYFRGTFGIDLDYETVRQGMLMVSVSGTAVKI
jgi:hypothetical protein